MRSGEMAFSRRGKMASALVAAAALGLAALALLSAIATDRSLSLAELSKPASSLAASVMPAQAVAAHQKAVPGHWSHGARGAHRMAALQSPAMPPKAAVAHKKAALAALSPAMSALDRAKELKERTEWLNSEEARLQEQEKNIAATKAKYQTEYQAALLAAAGNSVAAPHPAPEQVVHAPQAAPRKAAPAPQPRKARPAAPAAPAALASPAVEAVKAAEAAVEGASAEEGVSAEEGSSADASDEDASEEASKGKTGFIHWKPAMGTDISFIQTNDYPLAMKRTDVEQGIQRIISPELGQKLAFQPKHAPTIAAKAKGFVKAAKTTKFAEVVHKAKQAKQAKTAAAPSFMADLTSFLAGEFDMTPAQKAAKVGKTGLSGIKISGMKTVPGQMKSLNDYGLDEDGEPGAAEWEHPEHMGSPCSVAGNCNHGEFKIRDDDYYWNKRGDRFLDEEAAEDPADEPASGEEEPASEAAEGGGGTATVPEEGAEEAGEEGAEDSEEPAPAEEEEGEEEPAGVKLGDRQVGMSLDDIVTPDDVEAHNLLTSSAYGTDHFAHLAAKSPENMKIMYGRYWQRIFDHADPHKLDHLEKGQFGGADETVPSDEAFPKMPGYDPDHFADWPHDSEKNMRMIHGRYWKDLKRDGVLDRQTPFAEAWAQNSHASHDRTVVDHIIGTGFYHGMGSKTYADARHLVGGDDWPHQVFTGTDEVMEDAKGTQRGGRDFFKAPSSMLHRTGPLPDFQVVSAAASSPLADFTVAPRAKQQRVEAAMRSAVKTLKPVAGKAAKATRLHVRASAGQSATPAKAQGAPVRAVKGGESALQAAGLGALKDEGSRHFGGCRKAASTARMIWALSAVDDGIAAQESSDEQQGSMAAAVAEATEQALRPAANFEYGRYKQWGGDAWGHKRWGWSVEPRDLARFDAANLKTPRPTMAAALASATAHAQMGAAELHGGYLAAFLETFTSTETSPALWAALEDSAAAANAGAGGRGNRAFALWQALAVAGDRVPPVAELALRAPLNAVAEWMVLWKYLRHDDLPDGWKAAKHGTKAHQYLQSAVDAGIAARGSLELVWTARQAWR